jgi:hypothetical protein
MAPTRDGSGGYMNEEFLDAPVTECPAVIQPWVARQSFQTPENRGR